MAPADGLLPLLGKILSYGELTESDEVNIADEKSTPKKGSKQLSANVFQSIARDKEARKKERAADDVLDSVLRKVFRSSLQDAQVRLFGILIHHYFSISFIDAGQVEAFISTRFHYGRRAQGPTCCHASARVPSISPQLSTKPA